MVAALGVWLCGIAVGIGTLLRAVSPITDCLQLFGHAVNRAGEFGQVFRHLGDVFFNRHDRTILRRQRLCENPHPARKSDRRALPHGLAMTSRRPS